MDHYYELGDKVGEGGFGDVYVAWNKTTGEKRALKRVRGSFDEWLDVLSMRDVQAMLRLSHHPNLVTMYEVHRTISGVVWFVFEYMEVSLHEVLNFREDPLPRSTIARWMQQLLFGLEHLHQSGYFHRDLKPENLMLSADGTLKVTDFSLTRGMHECKHKMSTYVSTRWYRAPEVLLGMPYGHAVDIFAAGCILAEMHIGVPLFPASSEIDLFHQIVKVMGCPPNVDRFLKVHSIDPPAPLTTSAEESLQHLTGMPYDTLDLLVGLLHVDPCQRWSIDIALDHHFFLPFCRVTTNPTAATSVLVTPESTKESNAFHQL